MRMCQHRKWGANMLRLDTAGDGHIEGDSGVTNCKEVSAEAKVGRTR